MKLGGAAFITQGLFYTGSGVSGTSHGCGISNIAGKTFLCHASPLSPSAPPAPRRGGAGPPPSQSALAWSLHGNSLSDKGRFELNIYLHRNISGIFHLRVGGDVVFH